MINLNITVTGLDEALGSLTRLESGLHSFEPELKAVGDYLMDFFTNDVYDSQGAVYGSEWSALSPKYAEQKSRTWGDQGILIASGKMRASNVLMTSDTYMTITNTTDYAGYHQEGTSKMPQRQIMLLTDDQQFQVVAQFAAALGERIASML